MGKAGTNVFEISNRVATNIRHKQELDAAVLALAVHDGESVTNAHKMANIFGLEELLDQKQGTLTGYSGSLVVVTGVDFVTSSTTVKTVNITNGVITSVL